jgi:hypothetical protein
VIVLASPPFALFNETNVLRMAKKLAQRSPTFFSFRSVFRCQTLCLLTVFHSSQIDGIPAYTAPTVEEAPWSRPEASENHSAK